MDHPDQEAFGNRVIVRLEPGLRIGEVEARRAMLLEKLDGGAPIRLDIGAVESVDTAGAQLLLAFRREADRRGIQVDIGGASAQLHSALKLLGLAEAVLGRGP